jgi:hypothetical protein
MTSDELDGKVKFASIERSSVHVLFDDGLGKTINFARNNSCVPEDISEFLRNGDVLRKRMNSDTLIVCRNQIRYVFVLGEEVNIRPE